MCYTCLIVLLYIYVEDIIGICLKPSLVTQHKTHGLCDKAIWNP